MDKKIQLHISKKHSFVLKKRGVTLIEMLVSISILVIVFVSVYRTYASITDLIASNRLKVVAVALMTEQIEIARNLAYTDVGEVSGIPNGKLVHSQTITRNSTAFTVLTTVRNVDDPFDGTITGIGAAHDSSAADYKIVQIDLLCSTCRHFSPLSFTTYVAPKGLEGSSNNGGLFVLAFDASGKVIPDALVHIENHKSPLNITVDDSTGIDGMLRIVDVPPSTQGYEITVTKTGYSTDRTYVPNGTPLKNPIKPHQTVVAQGVTQSSFAIDILGSFNFSTVNIACAPVVSIPFTLAGAKSLGTDSSGKPVLKYSYSGATNSSGLATLSNLEWDVYTLSLTSASYDVIGVNPIFPFALNPGINQNVKIVVAPRVMRSLMVGVTDKTTGLPLAGASVTLSKSPYTETQTTGIGSLGQTDWSGGAGQTDFFDATKYYNSDGNLSVNSPTGEVKLASVGGGKYQSSGYLTSSTFDMGTTTNLYQVLWRPTDQPVHVGANSVKMQIATNNDSSSWYFTGPDGTPDTYYTATSTTIDPSNDGNRYLRYRLFLSTASTSYTPNVSDVNFSFTSDCIPSGQVVFTGLSNVTYSLLVQKTGFQDYSTTVTASTTWQQKNVLLIRN
jgi:prepilin-type N-terminal cleavage/methylation domain-containing protein